MAKRDSDRKYRHSKRGLIRRIYSLMKRRIAGGNVKNPELYIGLELLPKEDFIQWATYNMEFNLLHANWIASEYDTRFTPSVDRMDSSLGYIVGNIRWVTHAQNSLFAVRKRWSA